MKLAVNTYPFLLTADLEKAIDEIGEAGYKEIEFLMSPPQFELDTIRTGTMAKLKNKLDNAGISVASVLLPSLDINLCSPFPEMRDMSVELYKKAADMAVELNSRGIVVIVGKRHVLLPPPIDYILSLSRESVMRILDYTQYTDLCLNIETLSANLIDTVKETATFVDSIGSDRVKICFDVANVYTQEDVTEAARIAGNRINLVHISDSYKDHTAHDVIGTGEIDFAKVREALEMVNYNGSVVIEITDKGGIESINRSRDHLLKEGWVF